MLVRIPEDKISEIKSSVNIVDVISEVVRLKRTGKNFVGLCPFHSEKTPSFTVNPEKEIFYCFGCGQGGDIFIFLMKQEKLSYPEAIRTLAARYGISLPDGDVSPAERRKKTDKERIFEINRHAVNYYRENLGRARIGKPALSYLQNRGIAPAMIERFNIGYAPKGWDNLSGFMAKKGVSFSEIEMAGLAILRKETTGGYDRFRNRIIFPIMNVRMQPIGFGGRTIEDEMPKYLNSPETPVYVKSRSLYGLHVAKDKCRKENTVYIVEGYFDCIVLHQFGVENTVATLGTALTAEHIRMLKAYAEKMILVFDSDEAGIHAAARSIELFIDQDVKAGILVLPKDHDPDSYMRAYGPDNFMRLAEKASNVIGFLIDSGIKKYGMTPEGRLLNLRDMIEPLASVKDPVARSLYIREMSERLSIDETAISFKLKEFLTKRGSAALPRFEFDAKFEQNKIVGNRPSKDPSSKGFRMERRIIAMMLQFPGIIPEIVHYDVLINFEDGLLKSIGRIILEAKDKGEHLVSEVLSRVEDEEERDTVAELSINDDLWEHAGCVRLIHQFLKNAATRREKDLILQIKTAEKQDDQELLLRLLHEKQKKAVEAKKTRSHGFTDA